MPTSPINVPQDGDTGKTFWDDLANDITRNNSHVHDGSDSDPISLSDVLPANVNFVKDFAGTIGGGGGTQDVDISTEVSANSNLDARTAMLQLKDADNDYEIVEIKMTSPNANTIRIHSGVALSGNYRLVVRG
jgi:hypothetical protein